MAADWVNRLFQGGEQARGLSGDGSATVALDAGNSYYNGLRRFLTMADIAAKPQRLWHTHDDAERGGGLGKHIQEAIAEDRPFTDAVIILSDDDYDRALEDDADFERTAVQALRDAHADLLLRAQRPVPARPLGVRILRDRSPAVGGTDFELMPGEFLTSLVPNLYHGAGPRSKPVVSFQANLPGVWEGYREIGRLHDDQLLFTIGNHWLDNFSHPSLKEGALLMFVAGPDGGVVQMLNPDVGADYQVRSTTQDGQAVITLATVGGEPLAYLLLWDASETLTEAEPEAAATVREVVSTPEVPLEEALVEIEPEPLPEPERRSPRTILAESQRERIFTLQERGALLQRVHFSGFMLGYDVYLGRRGEVGTVVKDIAAIFQVRKSSVSLLAHIDGVVLNSHPLPRGESALLTGDAVIEVGNQKLEYRDLSSIDLDGWPYVGEIRRPASSTYMLWGREYSIGRSRECRVVLPDEPRNDNIVWKPRVAEGSMISTKNGDIPKTKFYTDSIMVASEHGNIELIDEAPVLSCVAKNCYAYIRRHGQILTLYPTTSGKLPQQLPLEPGDEALIGNCLFFMGFTPARSAAVEPAPAPSARVSADALAAAVSMPDLTELDAPAPSRFKAAADPLDAPSAPGRPPLAGLPEFDVEAAPRPRVEWPAARRAPSLSDIPVGGPVRKPEPPAAYVPATAAPSAPEPVAAVAAPEVVPTPVVPTEVAAPAAASVNCAASPTGEVVAVDAREARIELARPARLVLSGWMVQGTATLGNHTGAALVLPESRLDDGQTFAARDYLRVTLKGRRGTVEVIDAEEVRVDAEATHDLSDGLAYELVRRDDAGDEDFAATLAFREDRSLPDPRARLLTLDSEDPLTASLVTVGIPLRAPRAVTLGPVSLTATFDGAALVLADYLDSYRTGSGWHPFFVQSAGGRWSTAPEDGGEIRLVAGDRVMVGSAIYTFAVLG